MTMMMMGRSGVQLQLPMYREQDLREAPVPYALCNVHNDDVGSICCSPFVHVERIGKYKTIYLGGSQFSPDVTPNNQRGSATPINGICTWDSVRH